MIHHSVLLNEVLESLDLPERRSIIDATLGLGGHTKAIFSQHEFSGTVVGIDQDTKHLEAARKALQTYSDRFKPVSMNFSELEEFLTHHDIHFDGILFDLGVASPHLDEADRGFSYALNGPLDMRMYQDSPLTAEVIVNTYHEDELTTIFRDYGEETLARKIAHAINLRRPTKSFRTTQDLAELVTTVYRKSGFHSSKKNPATKVFQALRIAVNRELDVLKIALDAAIRRIDPGGRILIISYHSLEDRIVKQAFQQAANPCHCPPELPFCACDKKPLLRILTKRPIGPSEEEIRTNPRSRSAKMRVAIRI